VIEKCGCNSFPVGPDMRSDGRMMYEITYCPLHAAAEEMLSGLKSLLSQHGYRELRKIFLHPSFTDRHGDGDWIEALITKAEGLSENNKSEKA